MLNDYVVLALGVLLAALGGDFFVRSILGLARRARISPAIVAATLAAFATSSPELTVSLTAAIAGVPQIALGDALGSNVVNIALVLGSVLLVSSFKTPHDSAGKRNFLVAFLAPVVTGILLFDGVLSRGNGTFLLGLFALWLGAVVIEAYKQRNTPQSIAAEHRGWPLIIVLCATGLALLIIASRLIVSGASGIADSFGIDEFIVGATIVALGTSAPEIATALSAKWRGHDEVGLGTILGSNIFNGLFIVAISSIIAPISVNPRDPGIALLFTFLALAIIYPRRTGIIERRQGVLLVVLYGIYLLAIVQRQAI